MSGEQGYVDLIRNILTKGESKADRTGVGTLSLIGQQLRFDISQSFPLFTCKFTSFDAIKKELFWMISGCTNAKSLAQQGIHIWDANATRAFLDQRGLRDYEEGELGPIYGSQWRSFGNRGIDQLQQCIEQIKTNPTSRRIVMTAWNPLDLPKMALEPCHMLVQWLVTNNGTALNCIMTQRSADMGLGVPFNVASYALLTKMIAHVCHLEVAELVVNMGDCHIYLNHVTALREMIDNKSLFPFPVLRFRRQIDNIDDFTLDDIELVGYVSNERIKLPMAV